jgi:hypothetical protein
LDNLPLSLAYRILLPLMPLQANRVHPLSIAKIQYKEMLGLTPLICWAKTLYSQYSQIKHAKLFLEPFNALFCVQSSPAEFGEGF